MWGSGRDYLRLVRFGNRSSSSRARAAHLRELISRGVRPSGQGEKPDSAEPSGATKGRAEIFALATVMELRPRFVPSSIHALALRHEVRQHLSLCHHAHTDRLLLVLEQFAICHPSFVICYYKTKCGFLEKPNMRSERFCY